MTTPVVHGYPDWVRRSAQADISHLREDAVALTDPFVRGRFFVGAETALGISCEVAAVSAAVRLDYYDAQTSGNNLGSQVMELTSLVALDTCVPVLGPWVDFTAFRSAAGGTISIHLWSVPIPAHSYTSAADQSCLVRVSNVVVAGGAQRDDDAVRILPGWATWQFQGVGQAFVAELRILRPTAGLATIARYELAAGSDRSIKIALPPNPVRSRVTNSGAGNMNWSSYIIAYPGLGGIT